MPRTDPYRHTNLSIATGKTYRCPAFNGRGEPVLGVTIRCNQALSVKVAYGRLGVDAATAAGVDIAAALPFGLAAQTFASSDTAEGGTTHTFEIPPHATLLQLLLTNSSGITATVAFVDYDFDPETVSEEDAV